MSPTVIMFDLDDTLLDHAASVGAALDAWLPTLAGDASRDHDTCVAAWFAAEERHFAAWRSGEITFAEQRRRRVREVAPIVGRPDVADASDAELDEIFTGYLTAYESSWRLFDDALPCLNTLRRKGIRLAILTNGIESQQQAKVQRTGLDGWFERVFTAEGLSVAKPSREAFLRACEGLDVDAAQVLYVSDHPIVDVQGALDAGLDAVRLDRLGADITEPTRRIRSLLELPARLM